MKFLVFTLAAVSVFSQQNPLAQATYRHYKTITVTNNVASTLATGYAESYTFDHATLVSGGLSLASGADILVGWFNGTTWVQIDRALDPSTGWNTSATKIWFKTQASITSSGTDANYRLFYNFPGGAVPAYESSHPTAAALLQALATGLANVAHFKYTDGATTDYWGAAVNISPPGGAVAYQQAYVADSTLMFLQCPSCATAAQEKAWFKLIIAQKDGSGNFPIQLKNANGTGGGFTSCITSPPHPTGDGDFLIPVLEWDYWQRTGSLAQFVIDEAALATALNTVPMSGGLVYIDPAVTHWTPWGFEDGTDPTGKHLWGSLLYYQAWKAMRDMYTANGETSNATTAQANMDSITTNITAALWSSIDGTHGMFLAATGNNNQIDVIGSAFASYLGVATGPQKTQIGNYLNDHYATLVTAGYITESANSSGVHIEWTSLVSGYCGVSPTTGNYDNGTWSYGHRYVAAALAVVSPSQAQQLILDYIANPDPTMEVYGASVNGQKNNTASPMGALAYAVTLSPDPPVTGVSYANYSNVFTIWDDGCTYPNSWSGLYGAWRLTGACTITNAINSNGFAVNSNALLDVVWTRDSGLADNLIMQADVLVDSFTVDDAPVAGICLNSLDSASASASRGYCSQFRGNDATTANVLNVRVAWATPFTFAWTTGTNYRMQIARNGTTIKSKVWAATSAEPGSFGVTYTESNALTDTRVSLSSSESITEFRHVIVRPLATTEPTAGAGAQQTNAARRRAG